MSILLHYLKLRVEILWVSLQIHLWNLIRILTLLVVLSGCAHHKELCYSPPSPAAITSAVAGARSEASKLSKYVSEEGKSNMAALEKRLDEADSSIIAYQGSVAKQSADLTVAISDKNAALETAAVWRKKQAEALVKLWQWRLIATCMVLSVIGYLGLKTAWRFGF